MKGQQVIQNYFQMRRLLLLFSGYVLIWGMKYLEKLRKKCNIYVTHSLCQEFYYFIKKYRISFQEMQMPLSLNNNRLMADLLWENINNAYR